MKLRKKVHATSLLMMLLLLLFFWWINNYTISVNTYTVENDKINDEITIVQLTDLHDATLGIDNKTLIHRVLEQSPDIIAVTGDMFTSGSENGKETAFNLLKSLGEEVPVYYVNGEHDDDEEFFSKLKENGVNVLNYEDEVITVKNTTLHLYGIDNVYFPPHFDLNNAFKKDEKNFSILLAHMADEHRNYLDFGIDLTLSGDTHGGMFRLPYVGAVYDGEDFLPDKQGKLVKGLYSFDEKHIHISGGLGNYPLPVRFFNRPEVAVIKLSPIKN